MSDYDSFWQTTTMQRDAQRAYVSPGCCYWSLLLLQWFVKSVLWSIILHIQRHRQTITSNGVPRKVAFSCTSQHFSHSTMCRTSTFPFLVCLLPKLVPNRALESRSPEAWGNERHSNGTFPLQRGARFKRAEPCGARFWLRFHLA